VTLREDRFDRAGDLATAEQSLKLIRATIETAVDLEPASHSVG
jgi:hypothetical protein